MVTGVLTAEWLIDLEEGVAYCPPDGATWATSRGGIFDELPVARVVASGRGDELVVECPFCRTPRSGQPRTHRHGASPDAPEGVHGHRVGHGADDCSRIGYVIVEVVSNPEAHHETAPTPRAQPALGSSTTEERF